jgi:1-deoxy-D-xylulose-5-phosphate reductoisomerase
MNQKKVSILGSTGSIGRSTLEVIEQSSSQCEVVGLAAGRNLELLKKQVEKFRPKLISCAVKEDADVLLEDNRFQDVKILFGIEGAEEIARDPETDIVVSAITGINGLRPTLAAIDEGKTIALANKESMVAGGSLIRKRIKSTKACLIPVDSEHSGVFQCIAKENRDYVKKVVLTASGGPFFKTPKERMGTISMEDVLSHPRWKMGKKVTVDSATLMNKGLELIEARWLFDLDPSQLDMIIHPQSIVHCLVEMQDGSVLAQLSQTDMKIPIQYALTYPERGDGLLPPLDLVSVGALEFFEVDLDKFPLARLAIQVLKETESSSVAMNAANEETVSAFLQKRIRFSDIAVVVMTAVEQHEQKKIEIIEDIFEIDRKSREITRNLINKR